MKKIHTPHNNFVKEFFSKNDNAVSFFEAYMPKKDLQHINLDTLTSEKESFVDKELEEYFADLLFRVNFKDKFKSAGYIYLLIEHKSYQDSYTDFQILKHLVKIWDTFLKQEKKEDAQNNDLTDQDTLKQNQPKRTLNSLPVIIPMVLYHGKTKWSYGNEFMHHFDCPDEFKIYIPNFQYILQDLSQIPDDQIVGSVLVKVFNLILKYIKQDEIVQKFPEVIRLLGELVEKQTALEYLETIIRYFASTVPKEKISFNDLKDIINESFANKGGEIMQTIADVLRNEGMLKGMQKGMQQGMQQGEQNATKKHVIKMYKNGIQMEQIADILEIDKKEVLLFIQEANLT
jgi:predicted transposase/invertase (TIGR01784 family)